MRYLPLLASCVLLALLVGCEKEKSIDTSKLESSFSGSTTAVKAQVDKIVADVKAARYSDALAGLKDLGAQAKLTPEQQQAIKDVLAQVQAKLSEAAQKTGQDAQKTAEDLKKSVGR